jgi:hypothetical protein
MTAQLLDLSHRLEAGTAFGVGPHLIAAARIVEHRPAPVLIDAVPHRGAELHGAPPAGRGVGTSPVHAGALVPDVTRRTDT